MRKSRYAIALVLACSLLLSLVSLAVGSEKTELWVVYRAPVYYDRLIHPYINEFYAENPDIQIRFQHIPHAEYTYRLQLMFASGAVPDVLEMNLNQNYDLFAAQNLFMDLDPFVAEDNYDLSRFYDPIIERSRRPGGLYMIPLDSHPGVAGMFYNKTLFDKAGLAYPTDSWTYEDLTEAAKKLTVQDTDGRTTQYGLIAPAYWVSVMTTLHSFGGGWIDESGTQGILDAPGSIEAFEWLHDLLFKYQVSPRRDDMVGQEEVRSFASGQTAMMFAGPWSIGTVRAGMADGHEAAVAPVPIGPAGRVSGGTNYGAFVIPEKAQNPNAAWRFVKWLLSPEMQYRLVEEGLNLATDQNVNDMAEFRQDPWLRPYIEAMDVGVYEPSPIPANFRVGEMRATIEAGLDEIWIGETSVEDGLRATNRRLNTVLRRPRP